MPHQYVLQLTPTDIRTFTADYATADTHHNKQLHTYLGYSCLTLELAQGLQ